MKVKKHDFLQLLKFGFVGTFNTLLDYGLFYVFFALCNFNKNFAQILATILAMTNSYFVNRYWTFEKKGRVRKGEIWRFLVVNLLSLSITLLCLNLFHDVFRLHEIANRLFAFLKVSFVLMGDSDVLFCKLMAIPFAWAVNFLGNRFWVFGKNSEKNCT